MTLKLVLASPMMQFFPDDAILIPDDAENDSCNNQEKEKLHTKKYACWLQSKNLQKNHRASFLRARSYSIHADRNVLLE